MSGTAYNVCRTLSRLMCCMQAAENIDVQSERLSSSGQAGRAVRGPPGRYNQALQAAGPARATAGTPTTRGLPESFEGGTDAVHATRLRDVDIAALSDADLLAAAEAGVHLHFLHSRLHENSSLHEYLPRHGFTLPIPYSPLQLEIALYVSVLFVRLRAQIYTAPGGA